MTEMSVALCPFSPWLIDMGGPQETPVGDTRVHRAWREVYPGWEPLSGQPGEATCSEPVGAEGPAWWWRGTGPGKSRWESGP